MKQPYRKALRTLVVTTVIYGVLVAMHDGEFWPFSVYPMFSRGGHDWVRTVVREVSGMPEVTLWQAANYASLPGNPYPLSPAGINQNDIANFVSKSETWDRKRVAAMRKVFGDALNTRTLLVLRADGRIDRDRNVAVDFTPFLLLTPDSAHFNPSLSRLSERPGRTRR